MAEQSSKLSSLVQDQWRGKHCSPAAGIFHQDTQWSGVLAGFMETMLTHIAVPTAEYSPLSAKVCVSEFLSHVIRSLRIKWILFGCVLELCEHIFRILDRFGI